MLILAYAPAAVHWLHFNILVFCIASSYLLGERKPLTMVLFSLVTVTVLYLLSMGIGVILPRGAGFLRDFALAIESLLR